MSNVDIVAGLYDAFARGDVPAVLGAMHPEIHWYEAEGNPYEPSGEAWVGPDAIVENLFSKLGVDWGGFAVLTSSFHDAGDVVVVEGRYSATHTGTGKPLDAQVCHIWTVQDGRITKFQQYVDTAKLQDVMGATVP
ncbi:MAG: nuclear transport factor 2 family protein [Gemmatimonadota bacterium]|nr:nuclear transport factor 2 family protein [Gemmatimonadota bacterium]